MGHHDRQLRRFDEPPVWRVFSRRGTIQILLLLKDQEPVRFTELDAACPFIARQVLGTRLTELREIGIIDRIVDDGPPLATRYKLTSVGRRLAEAAIVLNQVAQSDELASQAA
jgi:DNA-binding HxlR family transcriptional regulator